VHHKYLDDSSPQLRIISGLHHVKGVVVVEILQWLFNVMHKKAVTRYIVLFCSFSFSICKYPVLADEVLNVVSLITTSR